MYIEKQYWDVLDKANLVGNYLCQSKNDYETGDTFYGLLLAPKTEYVLIINEVGIVQEHKTYKGFRDSKRLLDRSQYFNTIEGKIYLHSYLWKKSLDSGIIITTQMTFCNESIDKKKCNKCINQINEIKEFEDISYF